jgi:hypothetical protein
LPPKKNQVHALPRVGAQLAGDLPWKKIIFGSPFLAFFHSAVIKVFLI